MINKAKRLEELQIRLSRGEAGAEDELRRQLEPWVACMVRRMMRLRQAGSPLEGLIRTVMDRLPADFASQRAVDDPQIARQLARICVTLIGRWVRQDTVRDWRSVRA